MSKSCFHWQEYIQKNPQKRFPVVRERSVYKKWPHLSFNNGFHQHEIRQTENPFPLVGMNSIRYKICLHQPEKLLLLLGTEKNRKNQFTSNFSDAFQQEKKALIKSTWFEIDPKFVYTSRDEGFDENSVSTSPKKMLPLAGISAKSKENGFNEQE